jgi:hypothetical protein
VDRFEDRGSTPLASTMLISIVGAALRFNSVMATRISSCESESNLHHCFNCFVPIRALQFFLESMQARSCLPFQIGALEDFVGLVMVDEVTRTHGN